jgi:hypothetical protein
VGKTTYIDIRADHVTDVWQGDKNGFKKILYTGWGGGARRHRVDAV